MNSLCGKNITLRGPEPSDLDFLYLSENDTAMWDCGSTRAPLSRHQLWQYIDSYDGDIFAQRQLRMVIVENSTGRAVGAVDIYDFDARDSRGNVGIFITEDSRRKGYATEALDLLAAYARETLAIHQLAAWVSVDNAASIALFKRGGYKSKACLRSWIKRGHTFSDILVFQLLFE